MKRDLLHLFVLNASDAMVTRKCELRDQCRHIYETKSISVDGDLIPLKSVAHSPSTLGDIMYRRGKSGDSRGLIFPIFEVRST